MKLARALAVALILLACAALAPVATAEEAGSDALSRQAASLDVGGNHSCQIAADGSLRCWGQNGFGQLGYGNESALGNNEPVSSAGAVDLGADKRAIAVAAGGFHTCVILEDGKVKCWGRGSQGQLGYANTANLGNDETPASIPTVDLGSDRTAVAITASNLTTCAILDDGTVRCWGDGGSGRLGYGNTSSVGDNETPDLAGAVDLGSGRRATAIAAGANHTCALLDDGTLKCWGEGGTGQLGYGNTNDIGDNETPAAVGAVNVGAGRSAVAISADSAVTCALLENGTVRCWGEAGAGALGYGNTNDIGDTEAPGTVAPVDLGIGRRAVAITTGGLTTCARLDDGTVRCWGDGSSGRLGSGNTSTIGDNETPGSVSPVNLGGGRTAVAISSSVQHTCAQLDDGRIRCWGVNASGNLGYGNTVDVGDNETPGSVAPVDTGVALGRTAVQVSGGIDHTCAVLDDGTVRCWGGNSAGELGYGNTTKIGDDETPGSAGPVDVGAGRHVVQVSAGGGFTCALLDNGSVRCWGDAAGGQLGYGNSTDIGDDETPAAAGPVDLGTGMTAVSLESAGDHTCAQLQIGTTTCWGVATAGKLGYGNGNTIGDNESPGFAGAVNIGTGRSATQVVTGLQSTCARVELGSVVCWGLGSTGQLGYGNTTTIGDTETPATAGLLSLGGSALDLAVGAAHACALLDDHRVRCWGNNFRGKLGYGNAVVIGDNELPSTAGPIDFGTTPTTLALSAGRNFTCAVLRDGTVRCWGEGGSQLGKGNLDSIGDDETLSAVGRVLLGGTLAARSIDAGDNHACAILEEGSVRCWGFGANGKLGYGNTDAIGDDETPSTVGAVDLFDDPPTAVDDEAAVDEDAPATAVSVLANDTDPDGGAATTIASASDPDGGTVVVTGGGSGLTYEPDAGFCTGGGAPDTFTYTLGGGDTATVSVDVACRIDPDTSPPETTLTKTPKATIKAKGKKAKVSFAFTSSEGGSRFECRLDAAAFAACSSPLTLNAKKGSRAFEVRAVDAAGNADPSPARFTFKVKRKRR